MSGLSGLTVLCVEDEADLRRQICAAFVFEGGRVLEAENAAAALELFDRERPDVVVSDIRMPGMDGLELTVQLRQRAPGLPVILCTAYADVSSLVRAIELRVAGLVRKPFDLEELIEAVERAGKPVLQAREIEAMRSERVELAARQLGFGPAMRRLAEDAMRVAASSFNLLIQGETGVGKTRLAALIHGFSPRRAAPFISLHLAAIPETLLEGELFGHERGAYTGAEKRRPGLFPLAQGGTVFLDDVDTIPPSIQAKLLTVVETGSYSPLGSSTLYVADVRVIAATNLDLSTEVASGRFRRDLFYRLGDIVLRIPPLRERPEDVPGLATLFAYETAAELGKSPVPIADEALACLKACPWPGNIRELKSTIRRAVLFCDGVVDAPSIRRVLSTGDGLESPRASAVSELPPSLLLCDLEALGVRRALGVAAGHQARAAELLGVTEKTLRAMLKRHRIEPQTR